MSEQHQSDPVGDLPPTPLTPERRKRPWLRTTLRWSTAVVVCAAVGTGTAFAVMAPKRTDVPGLRTPADSRYAFAPLSLPHLPPKAVGPAQDHARTGHAEHAADLRKLLLPPPVGADRKPALKLDPNGWYGNASYVADFGGNVVTAAELNDYGVRHIAAESWTAADGVRTQIYLLGYRSQGDASFAYSEDQGTLRPTDGTVMGVDSSSPAVFSGLLPDTQTSVLSQASGLGRRAVRMALINAGDVEAIVVMSSPDQVPLLNFEQVVDLQGEMLQG